MFSIRFEFVLRKSHSFTKPLNMKRILMNFLIIFALTAQISFGQDELPKNSLMLKAVFINYQAPNRENKRIFSDLTNAFEIGYSHHFNNNLSLGIPLRVGVANFPNYDDNLRKVTSYGRDEVYAGLDALLNLHFWRGKTFSPFIYGGVGIAVPAFDFDLLYGQAPIGLGFDIKINDKTSLVLQSDYRLAFDDANDNWQHAIGVKICLCGSDRDKDGVIDSEDACPDDWGTVNGCPDADGDGIRDLDDKCPKEPGVIENNGCPSDKDRDGVYDRDDKCPDVAGTIMGCPDRDKDGVIDMEDACPDDWGTVNGCPDADGDGVRDLDDKCPKVPGPASNQGCPPDRDKDGFPDATDPCPDVAGSINGCPDTDGDGITDNVDKCPNTKGTAANFGCPEIKQEDKKVLDVAMRAVEFQTGTAVITKKSFKNLDEVLGVLKKYPEMQLSIEGHTDNVSDEAVNQKLSEKRAKACLDYLVKKGIDPGRLMSKGFGESKPIGDNKTKEGRQMNRRTEFIPIWR